MRDEVEMTSAEEFLLGEGNGGKNSSFARRTRGRKSGASLFARIKARMVMRIYGVSRAKAIEIIAKHEAGDAVPGNGGAHVNGKNHRDDDTLITAEEFFA